MNYNEWLNNNKCCNANWQCSVSFYTADQIDRIVSGITARIDELEQDLQQCCSGGTIYYRWVTKLNDYWCDGTTKMTVEKQQSSTDEINWYDTGEERNGTDVIEYNSLDCGYIPPNYKWIATYIGGYQNFQNCDDSGTIINREINVRNLTDVDIRDCVTSIGESAFSGATSLTAVTLPDTITSIGQRGFYRCSGLTSIDIPSGITSIEYGTFANCSGLTSVTIPSGVTSIGMNAFIGCSGLTDIVIPSGVTSIEANAFLNCGGITSATINAITPPNTPEPYDTFNGTYPIYVPCESVDAYKAHSGWTKYSERITCNRKWLAMYDGGTTSSAECDATSAITSGAVSALNLIEVEIGDCVTSIGERAFSGATTLSSVTIPDTVTSIGYQSFLKCSGLTSIDIPDSVTSIGEGAFCYCFGLTDFTIPSGITSIGANTFFDCHSLTAFTIPSGVTYIGNFAFDYCTGLTRITVEALTPATRGMNIFDHTTCPIYVPCESVDAYKSAWSVYADRITCDSPTPPEPPTPTGRKWLATYSGGTTSSAECDATSAITENEINESGLTAVEIGDCVTSIGRLGFYFNTGLTSVTIPDSVTSIGDMAFWNCSGLTSIDIPSGVTSIGEATFKGCTSLSAATIPSGITSIGKHGFAYCNNLASINMPTSVTSIGNEAFQSCYNLSAITIPNSITSISFGAFSYCSGLTSVSIPNSVTSIGATAFQYCGGITSIHIPSGVTSIGNFAFDYCTGLTSITVNATTPPTLGDNVFDHTNNCPIYVPCESVNAYKAAWSTYASRIQGDGCGAEIDNPDWDDID